jgi:hypothetical protein
VNTQDNRIRGQQDFAIEDIPKGARHLVGDHFACRRLFSSAIIDIRGKRHGVVLTDKPEARPKIGMGLCRLRDLADAGIQHGGDAGISLVFEG